ncbi:MAG: hypothetical protein IH888_13280 [Planctomycetes bacterium]|nr:hypothetical protein [Planctomycetota bacterium]
MLNIQSLVAQADQLQTESSWSSLLGIGVLIAAGVIFLILLVAVFRKKKQ